MYYRIFDEQEHKLKITWFFIIVFTFGCVVLKAQGLQDWKTITYMNDITDMAHSGEDIWVSTTGGVYKFTPEDSTYQAFTNIEGLGTLFITSIETDKYDKILTSSQDGLINLYHRELGLWTVYDNLKGEVIVDLFTIQDTLWVATKTGVGVFLLNEDQIEFRDFFSNLPLMVENAYRIAVFDHRVYYATENGLLHAPSDFIKNNLKITNAWKLMTVNDSLPHNDIRDVVPTEDSLLVGTYKGAASIDKNLSVSQITSWTHGFVSRILVSGDDVYFIRGSDYYKQSEDSWDRINNEATKVTAGAIDGTSNLWIGLNNGGIKKSIWDHSFLIDGPASNLIGSLTKDRNGTLWIVNGRLKFARSFGFYKYDFNQWTNYRYVNDWSLKNHLVTVYEDFSGKIWMGAWGGGISIIDNENVDYYHGWSGEGRLEISTVDSKKDIILPELAPEKRTCFSPFPVSENHYLVVPYFLEDDFGNLWSTSFGAQNGEYLTVIPRNENGDLELDCDNWIYFGRNLGVSEEEGEITAFEFDDSNRLWIGTFSSGILVFNYNGTLENRSDDQSLIRVNTANASLFSNTILSLKRDHDGIIWIGTAGGLSSFDGQNFFKHVGEIGPIENKINSIFVDNFNNKWFATDGGFSILKADESPWDAGSWVHYTPENSGLPNKLVYSIFVDQDRGEAYIGTESGLSIYSGSFSELKKELNSVISGPSPFVLDDNANFVIKNLVFGASVKILNVNGRLVRTLSGENGNLEGGRATWDGRDQSMTKVSSGVYIYLIYNEEGITASGKIAVINP
jgi:ligand-binding sensor domain-containing protein